jgi:hypothetical protein
MSKEVSNIIYSAVDIERYLLGKMSNEERYAIEKAALDDHLLAEAIEGYEGIEQTNWEKELVELKGKFVDFENGPVVQIDKFSIAKWWRVAAAFLLLIFSVAIAYIFTPNKPPATIAEVKKLNNVASDTVNNNPEIASILADTTHATQFNKLSETALVESKTKPQPPNINAALETSKEIAANNFVYTPNPKLASSIDLIQKREEEYHSDATASAAGNANAFNKEENLNSNTNVENDRAGRKQIQIPADAQNQTITKNTTYINGQVVGIGNNPLPYAQINTAMSKAPVFADAKGNFKIASVDTSIAVVVNAVGYASKKITLQNAQPQQKIVLDEAVVVLKEFKSSKSKAATKEDAMRKAQQKELEEQMDEDAEPVNGWANYNNYLWDNVIQNNAIADKQVHGIVEVFIKLNNDGAITKAKVTKSLCPECDAEAVRLVKQGPKWKIKNKRDNKARVKVKF